MAVTCGPGGIGWVGGSHMWTRWYRVGGWVGDSHVWTCGPGGMGWVGGSHVWTRRYRVGGRQSHVDQVV